MARQIAGAFRLFTAFGIDVFVHWSWFLLAGAYVYFYSQTSDLFTQPIWHAIMLITLFAVVTLHEMGHALACRSVGGSANTIVLWPLGGIAFVRPPSRPGAVLWSIAAGPLVNVALVPVTLVFCVIVGTDTLSPIGLNASSDLQTYVLAVTWMNLILLIFNMLPVYPLDGGQILQSVLWFFLGRAKSLLVVAWIGIGGAAMLAALSILQMAMPPASLGENTLLLVAVFIAWQAINGLRMAKALARAEQQTTLDR